MNTPLLTLDDVLQAQTRLAGGIRVTPCAPSARLGEQAGMEMILKHDYLQVTGSFKERGARNALACLTPEQRRRGVVAASAGNHALGLALHGRELGVSVTVVMPRNAPRVKAARCHTLGAQVVHHGDTYDQASAYAHTLAAQHGLAYVHPFDDLAVIAGQGTLALEALLVEPDVDAVVAPVGGGGLLAGVATVVKALRPDIQVIGVEPAHAAGLTTARLVGRPVRTLTLPTLADGLAVAQTGTHTFAHAQARVDELVTVCEDDLALALHAVHEAHGVVLEGAGVTALAACLAGRLPFLAGKRVLVALTGANIDPANHHRTLCRAQTLRAEMATA